MEVFGQQRFQFRQILLPLSEKVFAHLLEFTKGFIVTIVQHFFVGQSIISHIACLSDISCFLIEKAKISNREQ